MSDDDRLIRWHAVVHYRTENGVLDDEHDLEQLGELHDLVELGPHWDTIERIEVLRVNQCTATDLTVEQAAEL
jgi:hypothetical protein